MGRSRIQAGPAPLLPHAVTRRTMNNRFPILSLLALAPLAVSAVPSGPNFVIIVPDDQRWDATGFMQERMAGLGRIARFPWYAGMTPGMDRLSREGVHFDNAFVTHSICSPSRASMLTGRYAHQVGVVDNQSYFPVESVTYATLMRDAGWATGYFGKWHMHDQPDRPGFDTVATFINQGSYYGNFFHVNGSQVWENGWVDDVSTDYLLDFIDTKASAGRPFLAFLGFKTPHDNRTPPDRHKDLFADDLPVSVPSMHGAANPPFRPGADSGTGLNDNRNYFRTLVGADDNVVRVLDRLDALGIADSTVVIYLSDNGYYLGEHGLGDKRSAYEESMRIPMMIRYPALQDGPRIADEMVLNLDLAPTILDLAGLPVPDWMEGRSLRPLLADAATGAWRREFFFAYARDPAYPTATPALVAVRNTDGEKLVHYPYSAEWTELFDTTADPYEVTNLAFAPERAPMRARLYRSLNRVAGEAGFLRREGTAWEESGVRMVVQGGSRFNFSVDHSDDLRHWRPVAGFKGTGEPLGVDLRPGEGTGESLTVPGHVADHALAKGPPVAAVSDGSPTLRVGANTNTPAGGRNTVLIFSLPVLPSGAPIESARLEVTASRTMAPFNGDLWALGIRGDTSPVLRYHEGPGGDPQSVKLQAAFLDPGMGTGFVRRSSSGASGLTAYLQSFYGANPGYAGGQHLFLRISPDADPGVTDIYYTLYSADRQSPGDRPQLVIGLAAEAAPDQPAGADFFRVRLADPGMP
jgi:N-acetylglucosamine-6-sulfatase